MSSSSVDWTRGVPSLHCMFRSWCYFAHARLLAFYKKPLIMQTFEAWEHGPVVRALYDDLKSYGAQGVTEVIPLPEKNKH